MKQGNGVWTTFYLGLVSFTKNTNRPTCYYNNWTIHAQTKSSKQVKEHNKFPLKIETWCQSEKWITKQNWMTWKPVHQYGSIILNEKCLFSVVAKLQNQKRTVSNNDALSMSAMLDWIRGIIHESHNEMVYTKTCFLTRRADFQTIKQKNCDGVFCGNLMRPYATTSLV